MPPEEDSASTENLTLTGDVLTGVPSIAHSHARSIRWGNDYRTVEASASQDDVRLDLGHPVDMRVPAGYYDQVKGTHEVYLL